MLQNTFDRFLLPNRTALVTGARREIGRAIALALAGAGARIAIHHADTAEEMADADAVVREIEQGGGTARSSARTSPWMTRAPVGRRGHCLVAGRYPGAERLDRTAGGVPRRHAGAVRQADFRQPAEPARTAAGPGPPMGSRGWGRVVTIGSVQQVRPHPQMMIYAGTKAAQLNWAWNLARQFGGQGVTVNNLAPGAILTARNRVQMATEGEALVQRIPAGRLGHPMISQERRCCCVRMPAPTSTGSISTSMAAGPSHSSRGFTSGKRLCRPTACRTAYKPPPPGRATSGA